MNQSRGDAGDRSPEPGTGLSGIRVLEIGDMVSAPYATKLLADLGADVIKVEPPGGDRARTRGPFPARSGSAPAPEDRESTPADPAASGLYLALNTNKRAVAVDEDRAGRETVARLVAEADIIITNHRPERLRALGFDADRARSDRPELVICSVTPFGLTGPYADYRAEELTVTNAGGWAYQCPGASSEADKPPLKVFGHQTGFHSGMAAAMVALAAFDRAERTGRGDHIDFSAMAHIAGMLEAALIAASYMDEHPSRLGSRLLNPWGIFNCRPPEGGSGDSRSEEDKPAGGGSRPDDDLIFLVTVEQDQWERLVEFMGNPDWAGTGLFDTVELRLENEDLLVLYLEQWLAEHSVDELWHGGQDRRICFAPVLTMAGMERQEHLRQRGFFVDVDHPAAGTVTHLGPPFLSSPNLWGPLRPAPLPPDGSTGEEFGPRRPAPVSPTVRPPERSDEKAAFDRRRPLEGIRVLDFSWVWAGPYCTMHLAFLGAEVIKIESHKRPGLGRRLALHPTDASPSLNTSAYFNQWDQGKLSCELDLANPEAIDVIKDIVAHCDVVVENFATGVMDKLGLGFDALSAINPELIMASVSGYGSSGPLREYMGYGPTTGPLSGLTSLTGYEGGPPRELGISVGDPAAGITSAFAVCAAIVARRSSGRGCYIDTALWESTASNAVEGWMEYTMTGRQPDRAGNRDPWMAPHGCYRTGDETSAPDGAADPGRWISIACSDDDRWRALAALIDDRPEPSPDSALVDDGRFATAADRKSNEDALDEIIGAWVEGQDRWELTERLQRVGVAAFPSMSTRDLLADRHLEARGFFSRLDHDEVGVRTHAGVPWLSTESEVAVTRPAPLLGQHTERVLADLLGLSPEAVADLRARGVSG